MIFVVVVVVIPQKVELQVTEDRILENKKYDQIKLMK